MNDYSQQRKAMVDSQVRPSDVVDRRIPRAMLTVARERFVPLSRQAIAYMDGHIKVSDGAGGRYLLAPRVLGKLIQSLELGDKAAVLDLACSTGYSTAVLAAITPRVVAVESDAGLAGEAQARLADVKGLKLLHGPLTLGAPAEGPFDAILINGAVEVMPEALLDQLKDGGGLAAVRLAGGVGVAMLWQRHGTRFDQRALFDAEAPLLAEFARKAEFVF